MLKTTKFIACILVFILSINSGYKLINETKDNNISINVNDNYYLGNIRIDKIKLNRPLYKIDSVNNDLKNNIKVVKQEKKLIILAAHSGTAKNAYFNNLDKLKIGDVIVINDKEYILNNKYDELKDGNLRIYFDKSKDTSVLITCNKKNHKYQTIYVSYLK